MKSKYLWFTDTHLDIVTPWNLIKFILHIRKEKPAGIFLTGDISNGLLIEWHLKLLATYIKCPIYFVLGNHDYHFSSMEKIHNKIRELCKKYSNLIWVTDEGVVHLTEKVALIGHEGWYDAVGGKPEYLKFTFDWWLTKEFRQLPSMLARMEHWKKMSEQSAHDLTDKIEKCIERGYKTVYVLTHFPPWREATRDVGTLLETFWIPYNVNMTLGKALRETMKDHKKRYITVYSRGLLDSCRS